MTYQTFSSLGISGDSNSEMKLEKLGLPENLTGKRVLDLGCNLGFFCFEAAKRGAKEVVGIDSCPDFIAEAEKLNTEHFKMNTVKFKVQDWEELLMNFSGEKFDVVLWLSGFHYARAQQHVLLRKIITFVLSRDGVLILECGISEKEPGQIFVEKFARAESEKGNEPYYPNMRAMDAYLGRFDYILHGESVMQAGDPIKRYVFHAKNRSQKNLTAIFGESNTGKSYLATKLADGEIIVRWDTFLLDWIEANKGQLEKFLLGIKEVNMHLGQLWTEILRDRFLFKKFCGDFTIELLAINNDIIVEGYGIQHVFPLIKKRLAEVFKIREIEVRSNG